MSRTNAGLNAAVRIVFLVLITFLIFFPGVGLFVLIFFVPIVGWLLWRDQDRIAALERRVAALENPGASGQKPPVKASS